MFLAVKVEHGAEVLWLRMKVVCVGESELKGRKRSWGYCEEVQGGCA